MENVKKEKMLNEFQHRGFNLRNRLLPSAGVYKTERLWPSEKLKNMTNHFFWKERKKQTNKWNNKHEYADSLLHNTTSK